MGSWPIGPFHGDFLRGELIPGAGVPYERVFPPDWGALWTGIADVSNGWVCPTDEQTLWMGVP